MGERTRKAVSERFWEKVAEAPDSDCWIWQACRNRSGYGTFGLTHNTSVLAHRWSYEEMVAPIPRGLVIDHLCRNRACVNPDHLEPVTPRVNTLRGDTLPADNILKTKCVNGHDFTPENTYRDRAGNRECRTCIRAKRASRREYDRERKREKRKDPEYLRRHREYMREARRKAKAASSG